ncbi:MAG: hypothetical protein M3O70_23835 [Actinomycetota bacterium]|nr:hypothetical protein [Actinomycetota bacterium]
MQKIVAGLFASLDGVAESPDRWVFPYFTQDVGKTAEDDRFTPFINGIPKFVVRGPSHHSSGRVVADRR